MPPAGPGTGADRGCDGGRRAFPARRSARPGRPQAAAGEPVRPCRQGRRASRLPDDRLDATHDPGRMVRRFRGRSGAGPARVRHRAAGRRYHLDAGADLAVADGDRPRRAWPGGASRRRRGGRRHLGHRHDRRRRAGPCGGARRDRRPDRPPALPLPPAAAARRPGDRRHRLGRHGYLRRAGAGPRPHLPRQQCWRRDRRRPRAAVRRGARCRPGPARHLPDRWRRLRTAAGHPAGARGSAAAGCARRRHGCHAYRRVSLRAARGQGARARRDADGALQTGGWSHF